MAPGLTSQAAALLAEQLHEARAAVHFSESALDGTSASRQSYIAALQRLSSANRPINILRQSFIDDVTDYRTLLEVALWEIRTFNLEEFASFPVYNFSRGLNPVENVAKGERFINRLSSLGARVWSQVPYLDLNVQTRVATVLDPDKVFEDFYEPLMAGRHLKTMSMIEGWEASLGCCTERDCALAAGMPVRCF